MAEHYYGATSEDSPAVAIVNDNTLSQSHNLSQLKQFVTNGQLPFEFGDSDFMPTTNPAYFTTAAVNMNNIDMTNYNNADAQIQQNLQYNNYQNKNNTQFSCNNTQVPNMKHANINYMCNNSLLNTHINYGKIMSNMQEMNHAHIGAGGSATYGGTINGCPYANLNGSGSCYNRNRFMPYNHNRGCATAAAAKTTGGANEHVPSLLTNANSHPQSAPFYYTNAGNTMTTAIRALTPSSTGGMKHAMTTSNYECVQYLPKSMLNSMAYNNYMPTFPTASITTSPQRLHATHSGNIASAGWPINGATTCTGGTVVCNFKMSNMSSVSTTSSATVISSANIRAPPSIPSTAAVTDANNTVTLQITNLDSSMDEASLRSFLLKQLKPITPVVSLGFEGNSYAKVTVPDLYFAKHVVSNLHRKKIGHKRMLVSYTRDSSLTEINTLRCQVAGLLKDVPYFTLPMYKFRELFQSRFKTSISVLDLYKMQDICTINSDNEDKFISLQPDLVHSLECSPLVKGLQHSAPYCPIHFKREQHKGWADQEIEPLPNVYMTKSDIQKIIYPLLKKHPNDIPVASLVHCIEGELNLEIKPNENGVNLEHLICCVQGVQIQVNNFGIKVLGWLELNKEKEFTERNTFAKNTVVDPLFQISREVIELLKMSPKSTMKFSRFIPAYHNHFGKQCRVADYGYTKLIELFEALSSVVQILGDGENRQITLTHRIQIRRFTSDLLRVLRAHGNNSVLLSQLPNIFTQTQNRNFDITDYGVCDIVDILDGLVNSNIVVVTTVQKGKDILISIPKRKQTNNELEKICVFAGEMVELLRNAVQYTILFQKFVRSYHYHFGYQCRLSDYGFLKLADLMDSIHGVVEMEQANDEDKKIYLSPKVARRVFAEQCEELIHTMTGSSTTCMELNEVLKLHKKKYGYQMQPQTLGVSNIIEAIELMPYIEWFVKDASTWIVCHKEDALFRMITYRAVKFLINLQGKNLPNKKNALNSFSNENNTNIIKSIALNDFIENFNEKQEENLTETTVKAMKHAIQIYVQDNVQYVKLTILIEFLMQIIYVLQQRTILTVHELKSALDCNLETTFQFGYPSLYALLTAYPDMFFVNVGTCQERSEVSLLGNCELCLSCAASEQSLLNPKKLSFKCSKTSDTYALSLGEYNTNTNHSPQAEKQRGKSCQVPLDNSYHTPNFDLSSVLHKQEHNSGNIFNTASPLKQQHNSSNTLLLNSTINAKHNNISCHMHSFNKSYNVSSASSNSTLLNSPATDLSNGSNKENSFNSSVNIFNSSINTSYANTSFEDLKKNFHSVSAQINMEASLPPVVYPIPPNYNSKHCNRRDSMTTLNLLNPANSYYQKHVHQQQLKHQKKNLQHYGPNSLKSASIPNPIDFGKNKFNISEEAIISRTNSEEEPNLYEIVNNVNLCQDYQSSKPDTSLSDIKPFWIDPIWSSNMEKEEQKNNLLNIRLPDIKSMSVLPMLLSPYSLSKTENMKQAFNFDSHDRKIA